MIKKFSHKGLKDFFEKGSKKSISPGHAKRLRLILARLEFSKGPEDMNLPGFKLHQMKGNLEGYYAVCVSGNWRVIFQYDGPDAVNVNYLDYH